MLTEVKNTLKYIFASLKCNIKAALEYKKSFIIQTVFMIVNNLFFLIYWIVVFSINDGDLNGLVMKDILLLWTLPNGAWGIANFFFGGLRDIDKLIITGGLDSYLLQPKNLIVSIATSRCNFGSCGDLLYGLVLGIIVSLLFNNFNNIILKVYTLNCNLSTLWGVSVYVPICKLQFFIAQKMSTTRFSVRCSFANSGCSVLLRFVVYEAFDFV